MSSSADPAQQERMLHYINLKLGFLGCPTFQSVNKEDLFKMAAPLLRGHAEQNRIFSKQLSPADQRIQNFLDSTLKDTEPKLPLRLPAQTFILDQSGMARMLSLAPDRNIFASNIITSYRLKQGILHNPKNDRRTTQGAFHIAEGGFPIPDDKVTVPKQVFRRLLDEALHPSADLMRLPFTSSQENQAEVFVSLLLRPLVSPEVKGILPQKTMEIRFFAPGNLVSNLDFVETIFGNAGDPYLAENDAALDTEHWTGHTGCVILAPQLVHLRKMDLGLPAYEKATGRQRRDGMCWKDPHELYNLGEAFKVTCRDHRGVVTLIADNYFGYCKKEVKTQISYAANLYGLCEEEHSGGAIAYCSYDLGEEFSLDPLFARNTNTFQDVVELLEDKIEIKPEGYAVDRQYKEVIYVPEGARFYLPDQSITWVKDGREQSIRLLANHIYLLPSGYKIFMKKQTGGPSWHLIGVVPEGVLCHKPCTVSGGGKSEISKSIVDAMIQGPVFTADFHKDMDRVAEILKKDFANRFKKSFARKGPSRPILSPQRTLGSVIKLLTASGEYTAEYNKWVSSIPDYIKDILLTVKRFYRPEWGEEWKKYFSVDIVNGHLAHELRFRGRKLVSNYLRVGRQQDGSWRIFRVRQDFAAAEKIQTADDITASIVIPRRALGNFQDGLSFPSVKFIANCENYLFQRPDDAIYRGYDKLTEADLSSPGNFISNFEPLDRGQVIDIVQDAVNFDLYTEPVKKLLLEFLEEAKADSYVSSPAHPRLVEGKPSKNPRYLQQRPDHVSPRKNYLAQMGFRLFWGIKMEEPVYFPVQAVLPGRRNNLPDPANNIPALAVYNPIHYQELPELFLDFICSLTGKSPSTTGFGSEGALTKGPFNALWPIVDLNNALVSFLVTGYQAFSSAAGYIGPHYRVDHDISLLMPEIWCRMRPEEQDAATMIQNGFLEKLKDFEHKGKIVRASILGCRITQRFVNTFLGRIFNNPDIVFTPEMLAPEKQDMDLYAEGIENILITQERAAEHYFADGSVDAACPPLKALLHIMKHGHFEGKGLSHPELRSLFTRAALLTSDWYKERLVSKQAYDIELLKRHIASLETFLARETYQDAAEPLNIAARLALAKKELVAVQSPEYLERLTGTLGRDPFRLQTSAPSAHFATLLWIDD